MNIFVAQPHEKTRGNKYATLCGTYTALHSNRLTEKCVFLAATLWKSVWFVLRLIHKKLYCRIKHQVLEMAEQLSQLLGSHTNDFQKQFVF